MTWIQQPCISYLLDGQQQTKKRADERKSVACPTFLVFSRCLPTIQYAITDTTTAGIILIGMRSQRILAKK